MAETKMNLALRSDRRKKPEYKLYRTYTRDEVLKLQPGDEVWWLDPTGRLARVKVNGKVRTWKREPERAIIPLKFGMYECWSVSLYEAMAFLFKEVNPSEVSDGTVSG